MHSEKAEKIAEIHVTSVNRIVQRYQKEGIEAITGVRHRHEHHYLSKEDEEVFL